MKRMFEYQCSKGHRNEAFTYVETEYIECPQCEELAFKVISAPNLKLDGVSGHFPSEWDRWAKKHQEATKLARKKAQDHGPTSLPGLKF